MFGFLLYAFFRFLLLVFFLYHARERKAERTCTCTTKRACIAYVCTTIGPGMAGKYTTCVDTHAWASNGHFLTLMVGGKAQERVRYLYIRFDMPMSKCVRTLVVLLYVFVCHT